MAIGEECSKIFIVEPMRQIEDDPNVIDQKFPGNPSCSYRTWEPLQIVGEIDNWKKLALEVIEKTRKQMAEVTLLGIKVINK